MNMLVASYKDLGLKNYQIINKYFGKNYKGYMKAWYDINDEYAAWFPKVSWTLSKPNWKYGGTQNYSNVIEKYGEEIYEYDFSKAPSAYDREECFDKNRLVFAKVDDKVCFLGVYKRVEYSGMDYQTYKYVRISTEIDTDLIVE